MGRKTNYVSDDISVTVAATDPAIPTVGGACVVGGVPGVCVESEDANGEAVVRLRGIFRLPVEATDAGTDDAVVAGDKIYYLGTRDVVLGKTSASATQFGYALEAVAGGATGKIKVLLRGA